MRGKRQLTSVCSLYEWKWGGRLNAFWWVWSNNYATPRHQTRTFRGWLMSIATKQINPKNLYIVGSIQKVFATCECFTLQLIRCGQVSFDQIPTQFLANWFILASILTSFPTLFFQRYVFGWGRGNAWIT